MLSIIIPARNEQNRIGPMLDAYSRFFINKNSEIIVVINNSSDRTLDVVKNYQKKFPFIKYQNLKPGGKGFATMSGFKEALQGNSNLIGFVDADMSTKPEDFYELYKNIEDYDGVIGSRWKKGAVTKRSLGKLIRSRGFNLLVRALFLFPYQDTQCGAKIFKREVVKKLYDDIKIPEWAFDVNILYICKRNGFSIKEFPTIWEDKDGSGINKPFKIPIQMAAGVIRLRLLYSPFEFVVRAYDQILPEDYKIHSW